jgi:phosphoglycerate dehydrogenase-like enzyme
MEDMLTLDQNTGLQKRLGFIGLGYMGSRIAKRLRNAGYPLIVFNRDPAITGQCVPIFRRG